MEAWAHNGACRLHDKRHAAEKAQEIFDRISNDVLRSPYHEPLVPNLRSFQIIMGIWCASDASDAGYRATTHLAELERRLQEEEEGMEITLEDYHMVLEALSKSPTKYAARAAVKVLTTMEDLYIERDTEVRPDFTCYKLALATLENSFDPNLGPKADKLFNTIQDRHFVPDTGMYTLLIRIWSNSASNYRSKNPTWDATRADELLKEMDSMFERVSSTVILPSTVDYNNVIRAWAICGETGNAESLLETMERASINGVERLDPDHDSYYYAMRAWLKSESPESVWKVSGILNRMKNRYKSGREEVKPNVSCFNALMEAATVYKGPRSGDIPRRVLQISFQALKEMKKYDCVPLMKTYAGLVQSCTNLLPKGRERTMALEAVFRSCCEDGLISEDFIDHFQSHAPYESYQRIILDSTTVVKEGRAIPVKWTRNTPRAEKVKMGGLVDLEGKVILSDDLRNHGSKRLLRRNQKTLYGGRHFC